MALWSGLVALLLLFFIQEAYSTVTSSLPAFTLIPLSNRTQNLLPVINGIPQGFNISGPTPDTRPGRITPLVKPQPLAPAAADPFWLANVPHGVNPLAPSGYQWFRNVMDFGATGKGEVDDSDAINAAISALSTSDLTPARCTPSLNQCNSSTVLGALVYFPPGTYLISKPIFLDYYTQAVGSPLSPPIIRGSPTFSGIALFDTDFYIPGGGGEEWYQNQNNFYRQIRNFVLDLTQMVPDPMDADMIPTGIHWQVAQATSLQNIVFMMTQGGDQQGVFMENGSGGFASDLTFNFGAIGMRIGSQQFTMRNLVFNNCVTGIVTIWNWGWTLQNGVFNVMDAAIDARQLDGASGPNDQPFASISIIDCTFNFINKIVFVGGSDPNSEALTQVLLDNCFITDIPGPGTALMETAGGQIIGSPITVESTIASWAHGKTYLTITDDGASSTSASFGNLPEPIKPTGLLDGSSGQWFTLSRPQYSTLSSGSFVSITTFGAVGDGVHDSTDAFNNGLKSTAASNQILWVPQGIYIITDTILAPTGSRMTGESWPQIMASGSNFDDAATPKVLFQAGEKGDVGDLEISDILFTVQGSTAGAVLVEWNIKATSQGSAGMWDTHFRVGGALGSQLQASQCPKQTGSINQECISASLLMHITPGASAYLENIWGWVADHDDDIPSQTMISVYSARGFLIETSEPTWLWGTASEHSVLYQYQLSNASNIFLGFMQTETPYYQPSPVAPEPFSSALGVFANDPTFELCAGNSNCARAWALRIINSTSISIYGAGFYSFFEDFDQTCVNDDSQTCQNALIEISFSDKLFIYNIATIGAQAVVSPEGGVSVMQADTQLFFTTEVIAYLALSVDGADQGDSLDNSGSASNFGGVIFLPPSLWNASETGGDISCPPPCTFVLPPSPLPTPVTVSWPPVITPLIIESSASPGAVTAIITTVTTISVLPFVISEVPFWPVTVSGNLPSTTTVIFTPVPSIIPPSIVFTLPGTEALPPLVSTQFAASSPSFGPTPSTPASSTPGVVVILPVFASNPHQVTIQPQPTFPVVSIPSPHPITYIKPGPGTVPNTCSSGCGSFGCGLFGCGGSCGLFGCDGGCGIGFCGGGCGLFGCGPGCGSGACVIIGGGGGGPPGINPFDPDNPNDGSDPDDNDEDCTSLMTITSCTVFIESFTPVGATKVTQTTQTGCFTTELCTGSDFTTTTTQTAPITEETMDFSDADQAVLIADSDASTLALSILAAQSSMDATRFSATSPTPNPASPTPAPTSPTPSPTPSPTGPNLNSPACMKCESDLGASDCGPTDQLCLILQCEDDTNCQACGIDCSTVGFG